MTAGIFIKTLVFLCSICLLGFFANEVIAYICGNKNKYRVGLFGLPLFFMLGAGAYTFYEMFFSMSGIKSSIANFILLLAVFFLINIVFCFRHKEPMRCFSLPRKAILPAIIILIILIPLVINLLMAMAFPGFEIDMMAHFLFKAKLFTAETYRSSIFVHDALFENMQSRYPPLVAMFYNLLFLFGGNTVSSYQIVNYFILFLLGLCVLGYFINKGFPLWLSITCFFIFIYTIEFSFQYIIDTNDVLLSLGFLLSVIWLFKFQERRDTYSLALCAVLTGIGMLIKKEALVFSLIMVFILFWLNKKRLPIYILIWSLIAVPWLIYRRTIPEHCTTPEFLIKTMNITNIIGHIRYESCAIFPLIIKWWNSVFVLWIILFSILLKSKYKKEIIMFSLISIVIFFVYFIVIACIMDRVIKFELISRRILSHIYPMVFICVALGIKELIYKDTGE